MSPAGTFVTDYTAAEITLRYVQPYISGAENAPQVYT